MTYADPARWAERDTDAGTKPVIDIGPHVDDVPYEEELDELLDPDVAVFWAGIGCICWLVVAWINGWIA